VRGLLVIENIWSECKAADAEKEVTTGKFVHVDFWDS